MAKTTPRLHVAQALANGAELSLGAEQSHYLAHVLRLGAGDAVCLFNNENGEVLAYITTVAKKSVSLRCERLVHAVQPPPDIDYVFAPLKHQRLDYLVQKATELGARRLQPMITARTIAERVNLDRMRANVIEAAEQCNLVFVPEVLEPKSFASLLKSWDANRAIIFCDEMAAPADPRAALLKVKPPAAVFVGPEGGFSEEERASLKSMPHVAAISLGPRIMRADTAAVAALALVQATIGDWQTS
jgi:16S rRNA (uracil1498-N3)-methyltransferase